MIDCKHLLLLLAVLFIFDGCQKSTLNQPMLNGEIPVFIASIPDTKTMLADGAKTLWLPSDKVSIYDGSSSAVLGNGLISPSASAEFSIESGSVSDLPATYHALYPTSMLYSWDEGGYDVSFTLPTIQHAVPDGIADGADLLVSESTSKTLTFSHLLSALKFTIDENSPYIKSIAVTAGVKIAGRFGYNFGGTPTIRTGGSNTVTLKLDDDGVLPEGDYYILIPARNYKAAITVTFTDDTGATDTRTISAGKTPVAGTVYPLGTISGLALHVPFDSTTEAAADLTAGQIASAASYRSAACATGSMNSVWINSSAFSAYTDKAVLAARLSLLGFKAVYLSPGASKIESAADDLKDFIFECSLYRIMVYYSALDDKKLLVTYNSAAVDRTIAYNGAVTESRRFAGIAADMEPHSCKADSKPDGLAQTWSDENYGVDGENDQLLALTLDRLGSAAGALHDAGLKLGEATFYKYQIKQDADSLSHGSTSGFLGICDFVSTMTYLTTKEEIWTNFNPSLVDAGVPRSTSVAISVKNGGTGSIYDGGDDGWSKLLEVIGYLKDRAVTGSYAAFRGIDIFGFADFMSLWGVVPE